MGNSRITYVAPRGESAQCNASVLGSARSVTCKMAGMRTELYTWSWKNNNCMKCLNSTQGLLTAGYRTAVRDQRTLEAHESYGQTFSIFVFMSNSGNYKRFTVLLLCLTSLVLNYNCGNHILLLLWCWKRELNCSGSGIWRCKTTPAFRTFYWKWQQHLFSALHRQ